MLGGWCADYAARVCVFGLYMGDSVSPLILRWFYVHAAGCGRRGFILGEDDLAAEENEWFVHPASAVLSLLQHYSSQFTVHREESLSSVFSRAP